MKYVRPYKRWQKVVIWLGENPTGQLLWMIPAAILIFAPVFFVGAWWMYGLVAVSVAFTIGWNCAARYYRKNGFVPKL